LQTDQETRDSERELELRCPQCFKLYKVRVGLIHSQQPHFDCVSCHVRFAFDYPPRNWNAVHTKVIRSPQVRLSENPAIAKTLKPCPRCQGLNPRGAIECNKCQVVFAKVESISSDTSSAARPSLIKAWQDLLSDYSNLRKHMEFVDRCEELQALPFAMRKYRDLKEVQPHDSMAAQMMNSVVMRALGKNSQWLQRLPWSNIFRVTPLVIAGILMLGGLIRPGWRNFVGGGVSLVVLTLGFAYLMKGRVSWKDFWTEKKETDQLIYKISCCL